MPRRAQCFGTDQISPGNGDSRLPIPELPSWHTADLPEAFSSMAPCKALPRAPPEAIPTGWLSINSLALLKRGCSRLQKGKRVMQAGKQAPRAETWSRVVTSSVCVRIQEVHYKAFHHCHLIPARLQKINSSAPFPCCPHVQGVVLPAPLCVPGRAPQHFEELSFTL